MSSSSPRHLTVVMYHFIRNVAQTPYPKLKTRGNSDFAGQLAYLLRHYTPVTVAQVIAALQGGPALPPDSLLFSFDDGYKEHYETVFPLLKAEGVQGAFFPVASTITEERLLDVNKIHFILASATKRPVLLDALRTLLGELQGKYNLHSFDDYRSHFVNDHLYDDDETAFIKRLLQRDLPPLAQASITNRLFTSFVTDDERSFAQSLYIKRNELREMIAAGMYIGSHGYHHVWLNKLSDAEQEREIDLSLKFLGDLGAPTKDWLICYPYGGYDQRLISLIRRKGCAAALSVIKGINDLQPENAYTIERLDTNELPIFSSAPPCDWTRQVQVR